MTSPNFLGLPAELATYEHSAVVVVPIPFEATVSYGGGTAGGPAAILAASTQVELYDREFDREPAADFGIHTVAPLDLPADPASAVPLIAAAMAGVARAGKLAVGLGGEHTVSLGVAMGLLDALGAPITVVQMDAHSDLRDEYDGTPFSHACVARRWLDLAGIEAVLQLGVRSVSAEEVAFARAHSGRIRVWYREEVRDGGWQQELAKRLAGRRVFLTLDVDGLDPAVVPATGTPEPDGLLWTEALAILRTVAGHAHVVGIDCVELAPIAAWHAADFAVAKLVYKAITYAQYLRP